MGTADSFSGSGGAWNGAGDDLMDWLDSLPDGPSSGGPQSEGPDSSQGPGDGENPLPGLPEPGGNSDPGLATTLQAVARALRGGRGQGGGAGGGGRPGGGAGGSGPSGTGRGGSAAGRVGGRAAAGVAALRAGDTAELRALGLDPDELGALGSDYAKAAKIAEAAAEGAPTSIQDGELRKAAAATAIWGLQQPAPPAPADLVRKFVEEYLYRVITIEFGSRLRDGSGDGRASLPTEQTLRSTIRGMTRSLPVTNTGSGHVDLGNAIEATYGRVLGIWAAAE